MKDALTETNELRSELHSKNGEIDSLKQTVSELGDDLIYYSVIAINSELLCEVDQHRDGRSQRDPKYARASKKILRKIEGFEIRRPDGMGTLISGTYSYNYIHGQEHCSTASYPLLESLVFLCVLPLYQSTPNVTSNERELAFHFLSSLRRDFVTSFAQHLHRIHSLLHQHPPSTLQHLTVRIHNDTVLDTDGRSQRPALSMAEDENIAVNLRNLGLVMVQRMHGNYKTDFQYEAIDDVETMEVRSASVFSKHASKM